MKKSKQSGSIANPSRRAIAGREKSVYIRDYSCHPKAKPENAMEYPSTVYSERVRDRKTETGIQNGMFIHLL